MVSKRVSLGGLVLGASFLVLGSGCTTLTSTSKAPLMTIHTGGTKKERAQEYLLKQIKSGHQSKRGIVLGLQFFTDGGRPISGAREKDTLTILSGPFQGSYTIDKVLRLVIGSGNKRRRRVILRIEGNFFDNQKVGNWRSIHQGTEGVATGTRTFTDAVADQSKLPPEVPVGSQLVVTTDGTVRYFTIVGNTLDRKVGALQRVAYIVDEPLPKGLRNLRYEIRTPSSTQATKLAYRIDWRGSGLTGYNFTIGINRRRYRHHEVEDLLKSNPKSRVELGSVAAKRNAAIVFVSVGALAMAVGGFLALVRRDDFPETYQQGILWGTVGFGAACIVASLPITISANNDFVRASDAYNRDIRQRLELIGQEKPTLHPSNSRLASTAPPASSPLYSSHP